MSTQTTNRRALYVNQRHLHLPVRFGRDRVRLLIYHAEHCVRYVEVDLAPDDPECWLSLDLQAWQGLDLELAFQAESLPDGALEAPVLRDQPAAGPEPAGRPCLHFTAPAGWLNDPNGLVCYNGVYHLFYQHNPYGRGWGAMHWGHAVSSDLVRWQHRDLTLLPDEMGTMFSGSAVVDWHNRSGLQTGGHPPICLFYTAAGGCAPEPCAATQCMAFSLDGGQTWCKYEGNPVLPHVMENNRDPKVFWHDPTRRWVMALFLGYDAEHKTNGKCFFGLFISPDLAHWTETDRVEITGSGECPDMFPLTTQNGDRIWVFWAADGHYLLGTFDGERFSARTRVLRAYNGGAGKRAHAYAAQTYSDMPDKRRLQVAWLQGNLENRPYNQQMSLPVELSLNGDGAEARLCFQPAAEVLSSFGPGQSVALESAAPTALGDTPF